MHGEEMSFLSIFCSELTLTQDNFFYMIKHFRGNELPQIRILPCNV